MGFQARTIMNLLYAMAPPQGGEQSGGGGMLATFLPIILIFVIFYIFMIMPQRKQRKKLRELLTNLKKGDKVVTATGIHGTILKLEKDIATLQISQRAELVVDKSTINRILS